MARGRLSKPNVRSSSTALNAFIVRSKGTNVQINVQPRGSGLPLNPMSQVIRNIQLNTPMNIDITKYTITTKL